MRSPDQAGARAPDAETWLSPRVHFVLRFASLLVLGWVSWPGLGNWVGRVCSALANPLAGPLARSPETLEFRPEGPDTSFNAILSVTNASGVYQELLWDLRRTPYLPVLVFMALCAALPWKRVAPRLLVAALGLTILPLLSGLRLLLAISSESPIRLLELPSAVEFVLNMACRALVLPPGMAYAVPALLWLALSWWLDREALAAILPAGVTSAGPAGSERRRTLPSGAERARPTRSGSASVARSRGASTPHRR